MRRSGFIFTRIEISLLRPCAPGVGLRRRKNRFRSAQADRRPKAPQAEFIRHASRPLAEGLRTD